MSSFLPLFLSFVAGGGTLIGGIIIALIVKVENNQPRNSLYGILQACCAGVMLILSLWLLGESSSEIGLFSVYSALFGAFLFYLASVFTHRIPGISKVSKSSFLSYTAIAIHNLPEGISVALSTANDIKLGISLCLAIMLHNILEGMVVALPLLFTTNTKNVLILTALNGLMEPVGVIVVWLIGSQYFTNSPLLIKYLLSGVSGIMGAISFLDLIPSAIESLSLSKYSENTDEIELEAGENPEPISNREIYTKVIFFIFIGFVGGGIILVISELVLSYFGL